MQEVNFIPFTILTCLGHVTDSAYPCVYYRLMMRP